MAHGLDCK